MLLLIGAAVAAPSWSDSLAAGDCAAVVAALPSPTAAIERLAAARCLERLDQDGRAIELLAGFEGPLSPWASLVRARALLDRGRPAEAVETLQGVALSGTEDELLRGRALVEAKRSLEARDGLRALLETPAGAEARWWLAQGAKDRGDLDAQLATLRAIWTKHPTSREAERAAKALADAGAPVPDYGTEAGRSLAMERAKKLLEIQQAPMAIPLLDGIHTQAPYTTSAAIVFMAEALFDAKLYARALDWYGRASASNVSAPLAFHEALATARAGDYPGAAEKYQALAKRFPGTAQAEEATYKIPYMDYDAGRFEEARTGFRAYLDAFPAGKFARDARWFRAWAAWRRGDQKSALAGFDEVLAHDAGTEQGVAARYWKAVATDDANGLRAVLRDAPDTGYAWFAAWRLGVKYPRPEPAVRPELSASFLAANPSIALGVQLALAGCADWARPLLSSSAAKGSAATAVPMAWALIDAEDYQGAKALAAPYCSSSAAAREACLPRPHADVVEAIATEHGLERLLPYAIMNAESGLDPSVTSPAGARGMMQLMPALAADLAKDTVPGFGADDLYRAGVNARLGTLELSLLQGRFARASVQPSLPLVIAGYNGGGDPVERWLGTYTTAPTPDRFAEDISFTETRRYVRRVLGFLMDYRRAYGD